jgi:hypothetical protein
MIFSFSPFYTYIVEIYLWDMKEHTWKMKLNDGFTAHDLRVHPFVSMAHDDLSQGSLRP